MWILCWHGVKTTTEHTLNFSFAQEKLRWNGANGATRSPVLRACKSIATGFKFHHRGNVSIYELWRRCHVEWTFISFSPNNRINFQETAMKSVTTRTPNLLQYIFLALFVSVCFCTWPKPNVCLQNDRYAKIVCLFWITYDIIPSISLPISISNGILRRIFVDTWPFSQRNRLQSIRHVNCYAPITIL